MRRRWNKGVGAVRQRDNLGFSKEDQNEALYECKLAQWKIQGGMCKHCGLMLDASGAVWKSAKYIKVPLASWARGCLTELDQETLEFVQTPRSPAEIRERYVEGQYWLVHRKNCGWKVDRKPYSSGLGNAGPVFMDELYLFLEEQGMADLPKDPALIANTWKMVEARVETKMRSDRKSVV